MTNIGFMKVFYVDAGEVSEVDEIDPEIGGPREYFQAAELVIAETRGKARAMMCRKYHDLEFTSPMMIRCLVHGVNREPGFVTDGDEAEYYWTLSGGEVAIDLRLFEPDAERGA